MLRPFVISILIGVYLVGILLVDLTVWSGHNVPIFYAIPVLVVSLRSSPRTVLGTAFLTMTFAIGSIFLERPSLLIWPFSLSALLVVCFVSFFIALRRHEELERIRQEQAMIRAVEHLRQPLTIVLAYAQLLQREDDLPEKAVYRAQQIEHASHSLAQGITTLLSANSD